MIVRDRGPEKDIVDDIVVVTELLIDNDDVTVAVVELVHELVALDVTDLLIDP